LSALGYAFDEAVRSLWRGRKSGVLSTTTIALALFVLAGFLLLTANLERLGAEWSTAAEVSVYLKDDIVPEEQRAIERMLAPGDTVASHEYVSKAAALARFKQTFADLAGAVDSLGDNPIPASFEVRLRPDDGSQTNQGDTGTARLEVEGLVTRLRGMPGVADVRYDREWLARVFGVIGFVRGVGLSLGLILTLAAALTIANVVRLALFARRDEVEIMELVGAPQAFIRGPFVMEGVLQGGAGALLALAVLGTGFVLVRSRSLVPLAAAIDVTAFRFLSVGTCFLVLAGGMAVGCLGGFVAAWRR
jgi:cell division transport system permease protein